MLIFLRDLGYVSVNGIIELFFSVDCFYSDFVDIYFGVEVIGIDILFI